MACSRTTAPTSRAVVQPNFAKAVSSRTSDACPGVAQVKFSFVIARSVSDEAIQFFVALDCFEEFTIGSRIRANRWLAMTFLSAGNTAWHVAPLRPPRLPALRR